MWWKEIVGVATHTSSKNKEQSAGDEIGNHIRYRLGNHQVECPVNGGANGHAVDARVEGKDLGAVDPGDAGVLCVSCALCAASPTSVVRGHEHTEKQKETAQRKIMTIAATCAELGPPALALGGNVCVSAPMIHMNRAMAPPPYTSIVRLPKRSVKSSMAMTVAQNRTTPYTPVAKSFAEDELRPKDWKMRGE